MGGTSSLATGAMAGLGGYMLADAMFDGGFDGGGLGGFDGGGFGGDFGGV